MKEIMKEIKSRMRDKGITQNEIAKELKVSSAAITQYFQGKSNPDFEKFLKMVHIVYEVDYERLIIKFCEKTTNATNIREALEWSLHRWCPEVSDTIYEHEKKYVSSTAELYGLLLESRKGKLKPKDFFCAVEKFGMKTDFSKIIDTESGNEKNSRKRKKIDLQIDEQAQSFVLYKLCMLYYYINTQAYKLVPETAQLALKYISKIKSSFIRKAHTLSLREVMAASYLYSNEVNQCEKILQEMNRPYIKTFFPMLYISRLSITSELYIFTNYEKSKEYIYTAIEYMKSWGFTGYKRRIRKLEAIHDFIKITNGELENLYLTDLDQTIYYLSIKRSRNALEKIKEVEDENSGRLTVLQLYCKAIVLNDINVMRLCEIQFIVNGNIHYWELAKRYIDRYLKN